LGQSGWIANTARPSNQLTGLQHATERGRISLKTEDHEYQSTEELESIRYPAAYTNTQNTNITQLQS
jgi:hypothetical protein